jgi:hypothetical protein
MATIQLMMIETLVILIPVAAELRAEDAEGTAIHLVEKLGGTYHRDDQVIGRPIIEVDLRLTDVTDEDLKALMGAVAFHIVVDVNSSGGFQV